MGVPEPSARRGQAARAGHHRREAEVPRHPRAGRWTARTAALPSAAASASGSRPGSPTGRCGWRTSATTDVINPWLSNGRNDFRSLKEIVAGALRPGMTDREKAIALWRLQTTHRFHASTGDNEVNDPVKVFNVYGYTTCGNDSICLAGLWRDGGLQGAAGPLRGALHLAGPLRRPLEPPRRRHGPVLPPARQRDDRRRAGPGARPRPAQAHPHPRHPRPRQPGRRRGFRRAVRLRGRVAGRPQQRPGHDHEHGPAAERGARVALGPPEPRSSTTAARTSRSGARGRTAARSGAATRRIGFATASGSIARTSPGSPGAREPTRWKTSG